MCEQLEPDRDPIYIVDAFVEEELLNMDEHEEILVQKTRLKKTKKFLKKLKQSPPHAYSTFCALLQHDTCAHIVKRLDSTLAGDVFIVIMTHTH
jgi:hypothetical protein